MLFAFNGRATRNFLGLLVLMHFILFVDRVNLAAAATVMQKDLGLSNIALGVAFSAFNYAYAPFQLVGGWFADRFGARRTLTVCGLAWSITTIATGAVTGLVSLFAVRFALGMGEGATCRRPLGRSPIGPRWRRGERRSGSPTPPDASAPVRRHRSSPS
jgi:MFS family permease